MWIGNTSFVGSRPEVTRYVEMYDNEQKQVLKIKQGIIDLASIEFLNENDMLAHCEDVKKEYIKKVMPQKLKYNLEYMNNISLGYDVKIILKTIKKII